MPLTDISANVAIVIPVLRRWRRSSAAGKMRMIERNLEPSASVSRGVNDGRPDDFGLFESVAVGM